MKSLKGTKTAENLLKAFAGESQARNRYTYYASVADKEGYKQIRNIFIETADNEKEHAKDSTNFYWQDLKGNFRQQLKLMHPILWHRVTPSTISKLLPTVKMRNGANSILPSLKLLMKKDLLKLQMHLE